MEKVLGRNLALNYSLNGWRTDSHLRKDGKDMPEATWKPHDKHGRLTTQSDLPDSVYAFPKQRKEPLTDAQHVRSAVARFDQSSTSPMPTVLWRSRTSRKLPTTTTSTSRKRHGTTWAFILKRIEERLPPKAL
jgi:hypothetical protein